MRKILIGLIAGILIGLVPTAYAMIMAPKTFSDVNDDDWHYESIMGLSYSELVDGYDDGTFRPDQNITRAEASKLMYGVFNKVDIRSEFYELNNKYEALNAKINTLDFPGTCYYEDQWYQEGDTVGGSSACKCYEDGRVICPSLI